MKRICGILTMAVGLALLVAKPTAMATFTAFSNDSDRARFTADNAKNDTTNWNSQNSVCPKSESPGRRRWQRGPA